MDIFESLRRTTIVINKNNELGKDEWTKPMPSTILPKT
jgi:hypothetical protein